jgi:hypothetical protein
MKCNCPSIVGDDAGCLLMNVQAFTTDLHTSLRPEDFVTNQEVGA